MAPAMAPGANGCVGKIGVVMPAPPRSAVGFVHSTSRLGSVVRPKRLLAGTVPWKVTNATMHPSCLLERQARRRLKSPPRSLPLATSTLPPSRIAEIRRLRSRGLGSISFLISSPQHERALGVPDQHDTAALVVLREVVAPGGPARPVGALAIRRGRAAEDPGDRDLAVDRRVHAAVARVARRLVERDRALLGIHAQRRCVARHVGHRRVHVEAVELRPPGPASRLTRPASCPVGENLVVFRLGVHGSLARPGLHSQSVFALAALGTRGGEDEDRDEHEQKAAGLRSWRRTLCGAAPAPQGASRRALSAGSGGAT